MRATGSQTPFVGRRRELARLESHLAGDGLPAVLFLWGPGGVGKTALLRHVRARDGDRCWLWLRGEDLEASAPLPRARERPPAVVVVDSFERASKRGAEKWNAFLAALPAHTRVLMAGRKASGWEWREPGWDTTVRMMELGPLDRESADELLSAVGIADPLLREELVVWSGGEPLSLLAGAETVARRGRLIESDPLLLAALSARLLRGEETEGTGPLTAAEGRRVLDVAAVARAMDRPTLEAVMPGVDARAALTWLESLSVTHHLGARLALQDRLRHTIKTRLQCASPDGYREITRRLTEHFANRARTGEPRFLLDLAELIDDPSLRWAMGTEAGRALRTGPPRPEDEPVLEGHLNPRRWSLLVRWLREAPTHVLVTRNEAGRPAALSVVVSGADAPSWAETDPLAGPWLDYARSRHGPEEAMLLRDSLLLAEGEERSQAAAVGNAALVTGRAFRVRWLYVLIEPDDPDKTAFVKAMGYARRTELDVVEPEVALDCYALELGPGGWVETTRALVYRQLGLEADGKAMPVIDRSHVVAALRSFHEPIALMSSPLAGSARGEEGVEAARRRILEATEKAFDDSLAGDRIRKAALVSGYLDPGASHAAAARGLHLSRATYFRRLAEAVDRLCAQLGAAPSSLPADRGGRSGPHGDASAF